MVRHAVARLEQPPSGVQGTCRKKREEHHVCSRACQDSKREQKALNLSMYECEELVNNQSFRTVVTALEKGAVNLDTCINRLS